LTNDDLKYAWHDGNTWHIETVHSAGNAGSSSLALDDSGYPHISYYDSANRDLKYAYHDGTSWQIESVDRTGNVGSSTSLALDASSHPYISYYDTTHGDLKYTYWGTDPLAGPVEVAPRPNSIEGWGRVDLTRSLFPTAPMATTFIDQSPGLQTGETDAYPFTVLDTDQPLRVTLAWSDYPGSPASAGGLVNDLDLVVTTPDGGLLYPTNASQQDDSHHLIYDDGGYSSTVYRWTRSNRSFAVRFTPTIYPAVVDRAQFFLVVSGLYSPYFVVRVLDDDGDSGEPGTVLFRKLVAPVSNGWFTVDLEGITITDGDFYVELYYVGLEENKPYLALDLTSPTGRSYVYFDWMSWCVLPCAGAPGGNWAIRAVISTLGEETETDRVNNLVGVDVLTPTLGTYNVQVRGYNVPQGPQPYALVVNAYGPVQAGFTASPRYGAAPLTVQFTNTSSGPVTTWEWTFGDGGMNTLQHPTHTYTTTGVYTVSLTARAAGDSATLPEGTDTVTRMSYITVQGQYSVYLPLILRNR
jgi:hypothetical protein